MEILLWIGAFHLVCLGIFLLLACRAPVIEDEDVALPMEGLDAEGREEPSQDNKPVPQAAE